MRAAARRLLAALLLAGLAASGRAEVLRFRPGDEMGTTGRGRDELDRPAALAIRDPRAEDLWVADEGADALIRFSQKGKWLSTVERVAGAKPADFKDPSALAFDRKGRLWVSDTGNDRLLLLGTDGALVREVGERGLRRGDFRQPRGLDVGADGRVYVADMGNDRIQVLDSTGDVVAVWNNLPGPSGGWLKQPAHLAYSTEDDGLLWVARDGGSQAVKLDLTGKRLGSVDFAALTQSEVGVRGIFVDRTMERLFVADGVGRRILAVGWRGDLLAEVPLPEGVEPGAAVVNWKVDLFVADAAGRRILVYERE